MLVAAMNRCLCDFLTDSQKERTCTLLQIQRYRLRVSGPLLDRIDIQMEVPGLRYQELASKDAGENSIIIRERVTRAENPIATILQTKIHANAQMSAKELKRTVP
jgi:magnesium chelatase family protein